jgi:hypothetical protein
MRYPHWYDLNDVLGVSTLWIQDIKRLDAIQIKCVPDMFHSSALPASCCTFSHAGISSATYGNITLMVMQARMRAIDAAKPFLLVIERRGKLSMFEQLVQALRGPFDFSSERTREAQYFRMHTQFIHLALNGKRLGTESYLLTLQYIPQTAPAESLDHYTCVELHVQENESPPVTVPDLTNWSYLFNPLLSGTDERGPLYGIPHEQFLHLTDSHGKSLPFSIRYALYNNFIDFHSINDTFTRPMPFGQGIQDLHEIGQSIVHPASFIKASIAFGSEIKPGSVFQNGEVTLAMKGVSVVDEAPCALIAYDAGVSQLKLILSDSSDQDILTEGSSHYKGDISVDLATRWVRKATLDEYLVTEISAPSWPVPRHEYTVRHLLLRQIGQEELELR